jgi:excisionase family DNA binding protein|tara:strand:- start:302 stop:532 length:231 start_codon:yes stop_codon:yes gene_type:complete
MIINELIPILEQLERIEKKVDGIKTNRYLDIQKSADFTSLSISTLRRAVARGSLKCSRTRGKLLFRESDIERWLNG